jgi:hypothetical protein
MKIASSPGQDLRSPVVGNTKFPTDDSKSYANSLLHNSQQEALKMKKNPSTLRSITPHVSESRAGSIPKLGTANVPSEYGNDPLVQYLKMHNPQEPADGRTMGKTWPEGKRPHPDNLLDDNEANEPLGDEVDPKTLGEVSPTTTMKEKGIEEWRDYLQHIFDSRKPPRDKLYNKDHPATVGEVDALLAKFK